MPRDDPGAPSRADRPAGAHGDAVIVGALVAGTAVLGATLAVRAGSIAFSALGVVLACVWIVAALAAGPPRLRTSPPALGVNVVGAVAVGGVVFGAFVAGKAVSDHIPLLGHSATDVLQRAHGGATAAVLVVALLNAVGEEMFFRGTLPSRLGAQHGDWWAVLVYAAVTIATLNLSLVVAALVLGAVLAAERRISGGVLAPVLTHLTWSTLVILFLPH